MTASSVLIVNGWTLYAHPLFLDQLEDLLQAVEKARLKDPAGYTRKNATKRLAAVAKLAFEIIPQDPERPDYRQGDTLGEDRKHWMRAKFFQQYRLFFRFRKSERIIVLAWVNDAETLRAYGSRTDAYAVFNKMLDRDNPPDDWAALREACEASAGRLAGTLARTRDPG